MTRVSKRVAALAVAATAAIGLAACSSSPSSPSRRRRRRGSSSTPSSSSAKPSNRRDAEHRRQRGPDHMDTVPAYYTADYELERVYTRQLVSYPTVAGPVHEQRRAGRRTSRRSPDVATEVPTAANGGDHRRRHGVHVPHQAGRDWDTTPARQVTADDFLREFKAFFNPVSPVGNPGYYTSTIKGLTAYSNAETAFFANAKKQPPTAANIATFQNSHNISGITAINATHAAVHADGAGQRLHLHAGDAVRVGAPGRVRQLRAEQPAARRAPGLRRPVLGQLVRGRQVDHVRPQPGVEASPPTRCGTST